MTTYDLTQPIETGMQVYPGDPPVELQGHATHEADGYRVSHLSMGTHAGTHVDAPSHTEPDGRSLGSFPPERFRLRARRVDCRGVEDRRAIGVDDLPADPEEATDLLALWTGFDRHWGSDRYRDHPYLSERAAQWCARHELDVALDAFSPDPTPPAAGEPAPDEPEGVPAHRQLLGADRLVVENCRHLGRPPERFEFRALPLAVDADGAPVRAVAVVE